MDAWWLPARLRVRGRSYTLQTAGRRSAAALPAEVLRKCYRSETHLKPGTIRSKPFIHHHSCHLRLGESMPSNAQLGFLSSAAPKSLLPPMQTDMQPPTPAQTRSSLRECTARRGKCLTRLAGRAHPVQGFSTLRRRAETPT